MRKKPHRHVWTDEDAAYAAAQWASGMHMKDVAAVFGYASAGPAGRAVLRFLRKYTPAYLPAWHPEFSRGWNRDEPYRSVPIKSDRRMVKYALAAFVESRRIAHETRDERAADQRRPALSVVFEEEARAYREYHASNRE